MVFLNYSTMQMVAKIVYYGPGLCGKTTNLKEIYRKTSSRSRGEMVSLETETDRTLFFDLLPMDVGVIGGFKTKFQLYTVPGQVFYNSTRKLVLRGVDGIVFVADSQVPMMEANVNSFENLQENLSELGLALEELPLVFQYNKRDLPNISDVEDLNKSLNALERPYIESCALQGIGVFETLKEISKQTLLKLKAKALGKEIQKNRETVSLKVQDAGDSKRIKKEIIDQSSQGTLDVDEENTVVKDRERVLEALKEAQLELNRESSDSEDAMPQEVSFDTYSGVETEAPEDSENSEEGLPDVTSTEVDVVEAGPDGKLEEYDGTLESFGLDFSDEDELPEDEIDLNDFNDLDEDEAIVLDEDEDLPPVSAESANDSQDAENPEQADLMDGQTIPPIPPPPEAEKKTKPKAKSKPANKKAISSSLKELETLATQVPKTGKLGSGNQSVDSLLSGLVGDTGKKKIKSDKVKITAPRAFEKAQLNCVLLDDKENVVHTQLLKVKVHERSGKRQIKVIIDIEKE